nr:MAG TPA: hypothetical protein [Caudoviricetes sp.]
MTFWSLVCYNENGIQNFTIRSIVLTWRKSVV